MTGQLRICSSNSDSDGGQRLFVDVGEVCRLSLTMDENGVEGRHRHLATYGRGMRWISRCCVYKSRPAFMPHLQSLLVCHPSIDSIQRAATAPQVHNTHRVSRGTAVLCTMYYVRRQEHRTEFFYRLCVIAITVCPALSFVVLFSLISTTKTLVNKNSRFWLTVTKTMSKLTR